MAKGGDSIEIGLFIESARGRPHFSSSGEAQRSGSPHLGSDGPLRCSFRIAHRFGILELSTATSLGIGEVTGEPIRSSPLPTRNAPSFQTLILRRLLLHIDAHLEPDVPPKGAFVGRSYALTTTLDRGAPSVVDPSAELSPEDAIYMGYPADVRLAHEPTLEQLTQFAESLRGRKVTLFAHSKGSFAQHLTSYLTSWGLDVSHVSTESGTDAPQETHDKTEHGLVSSREEAATQGTSETAPSATSLGSQASAEPVVLIDDDVAILRTRLQRIRAEQAYPLHLHARKRPSLASHHRPRSSPQVARVMGFTTTSTQFAQGTSPVVIIHFTSLAHFKLVKDAIQTMMATGNTWTRLPEVIVVPKPAGPRRILTALHTAVTKPVVDPFFSPIATSPLSPSFHPMASAWSASGAQRSPGGRSSASWRTNSDRSTKSPKDGTDTVSLAPSSPLGISDNMEYFSDAATATKLGSSPSSGLVIQSPDGQPAGIFFHPKPKGKDNRPSKYEHSNASLGEHSFGRSRGLSFRRASDGENGKKGASASHSDGQHRGSRPTYSQDKSSSAELAYEVASPPAVSKGKSRQSPVLEPVAPTQPESVIAAPSDPMPPPTAPKLPRRSSQDPRYSPPPSPQTSRMPTGPSTTRRASKRPTAESSNSASAGIPKKGSRSGEPNIVPPISVLIVDGKVFTFLSLISDDI